ncbi:MAG: FAD binding domain-containing protein [Beijerinckiaceae bacterium]
MKAPDFDYVRVPTLAAAFKQLDSGDDVQLLAGGQSLLASLNLRLSQPQKLIDIAHIKGLAGITQGKGLIKIGALTRHCDIETSLLIREKLPLLSMAAPHIAHPAIRNRGTFGGSLALADPAAEWPACCVALNATVVAASRRGERRIAAAEFFQGLYATALESDEIITSVEIPVPAKGAVAGFSELARRHGDYALVGLAAQGTLLKGRWNALNLVFFGVGDRPILAQVAAQKLMDGEGLKAAQETIDENLNFSGDDVCSAETRLHLARVLLGRVLGTIKSNPA